MITKDKIINILVEELGLDGLVEDDHIVGHDEAADRILAEIKPDWEKTIDHCSSMNLLFEDELPRGLFGKRVHISIKEIK